VSLRASVPQTHDKALNNLGMLALPITAKTSAPWVIALVRFASPCAGFEPCYVLIRPATANLGILAVESTFMTRSRDVAQTRRIGMRNG
jgi:hypothetical protein